jgi:hypothetical protein
MSMNNTPPGDDEDTTESDNDPEHINDVSDEWGETENVFGTSYNVDLTPGVTGGGKELTAPGDDGEVYAGATVRREFERAAAWPEQATWIGYWEDKAGLRNREVGIPFHSRFQHSFLTGANGTGKTTVLVNDMVQLTYAGWGFCFIDPGGDAIKELLQYIPEYRLDDVVWVQPPTGEYDNITALNFLEVEQGEDEPDATYDARVSSVVEELVSIVGGEEEMYARMTRILRVVAQAMIEADEPYTILDIYQLLADPSLQSKFVEEVEDPVVRDGVQRLTEELEQEDLEPLQGRLDKWVMNKTARRIISHQRSSVDIEQAVEDGKIVLVNTNPGRVASDIGKIIASAIAQRIWATVKARPAHSTSDERQPYFLYIDELNEAITDATDLEEMLEDARKFKLGLTLATQFPMQLSDDRRQNVIGNPKNLLALRTQEGQSASEIMDRMDDLGKTDLMNLNDHEMYTRIQTASGQSPPLRVQNFAPYPPLRSRADAQSIIERSLERYGSSETGLNADATVVNQYIRGDGAVSFESDDDTGSTDVDKIPTKTILEAIYATEIRHGATANDEYVPIDDVQDDVERRVDGDLGYISKFASVIEKLPQEYVEMSRRSGDITITLTDDGRSEVNTRDTGSGASGGGHKHRYILDETYNVFTQLGCTVEIPTQDGENNLPDAIADLPVTTDPTVQDLELDIDTTDVTKLTVDEIQGVNNALSKWENTLADRLAEKHPMLPVISGGRDMFIEAESTTITRPGQTMQNLRKAVNNDKRCVFVVPDGSKSNTHGIDAFEDWAVKGTKILTNPPLYSRITKDGQRKLYTGDAHLTVEGMPVLRPADAGKVATWVDPDYDAEAPDAYESGLRNDHDLMLAGADGDELLRATVGDIARGELEPGTVPAWGGYDRSRQEHVVYTMAQNATITQETYEDKDAFREEWKRVSEPFIPEEKFDREPSGDDWRIIILPDDDNNEYTGPQLFKFNGLTEDGQIDWSLTPVFSENTDSDGVTADVEIDKNAFGDPRGDPVNESESGVLTMEHIGEDDSGIELKGDYENEDTEDADRDASQESEWGTGTDPEPDDDMSNEAHDSDQDTSEAQPNDTDTTGVTGDVDSTETSDEYKDTDTVVDVDFTGIKIDGADPDIRNSSEEDNSNINDADDDEDDDDDGGGTTQTKIF